MWGTLLEYGARTTTIKLFAPYRINPGAHIKVSEINQTIKFYVIHGLGHVFINRTIDVGYFIAGPILTLPCH